MTYKGALWEVFFGTGMSLKQLCRKTGYAWMSLPSYIMAQLLFKNMEPPCLIYMNRQQSLRHRKKPNLDSVVFLTCSCVTVITSHPFVFLPWSHRSCTFHTSTCSIQYAYRNPITSMTGGRQRERARNVQMLVIHAPHNGSLKISQLMFPCLCLIMPNDRTYRSA